jgi:hypothetical protein
VGGNYTERGVEKKVEMVGVAAAVVMVVVAVVMVVVAVVMVVVAVAVLNITMMIFKMNAKIVPRGIEITTMMMKTINKDIGTVPLVECMYLEGETSTYHKCNFYNN